MISKKLSLLIAITFSVACTRSLKSGHYASSSSEQSSSTPENFLEINVTGDGIISGVWKSNLKPFLGKLTSSPSIFGNRSYSIFVPDCNKDLPVSIKQDGENLSVSIQQLPACDISSQDYVLHLKK